MKLGKTYPGTVKTVKIVSKNIKGPEDEKVQIQVGIVQIEMEYNAGDLVEFIPGNVPDDIYFTSVNWNDEVIGNYELNLNEIIFNTKIVKISRSNKSDSATFSITFETQDLEKLSSVGMYVKIKEPLSQFVINKIAD